MVTLVIMDGFGIRNKKDGNAIALQGTPNLDKLMEKYPTTFLEASGNAVGLPKGQVGNSEAGHITIGAGRRFYQPLEKINKAIKDKSFHKNPELLKAIKNVVKNGTALHIIGLVSDGGIHSHIDHIKETMKLAYNHGLVKVYLHLILDGRDVPPTSGVDFVEEIQELANRYGFEIKSVCGRAYAMDREGLYDRTEKAYDAIVRSDAEFGGVDALTEILASYESGITDEFFEPTVIGRPVEMEENDSVILCNFRKDRMRQFCEALTKEKTFKHFEVKNFKKLCVVGFVEYDDDFTEIGVAFRDENLSNGLARVLSKRHIRQLHISETTKFPHVTYYFNCGRDKPYPYEDRIEIQGYKDMRYDKHPLMRANDITTHVLDAISSQKYGFIVVNFPNLDMIGHTGNLDATKEAVRIVDKCVRTIAMATKMVGGTCLITADHGNAEELIEKDGTPKTSHTTNPVPLIMVTDEKLKLAKKGELANIAPTILELMSLPIPEEMTTSLLRK